MVEAIEILYDFVSPMQEELVKASIRQEIPRIQTMGPPISPMSLSDTIEPNPALSVYLSQSYQQQQAYFDVAKRVNQGLLPLPFERVNLRPIQTLINLSEVGWRAVLPYKPYIYHNFIWHIPEERISIIW